MSDDNQEAEASRRRAGQYSSRKAYQKAMAARVRQMQVDFVEPENVALACPGRSILTARRHGRRG